MRRAFWIRYNCHLPICSLFRSSHNSLYLDLVHLQQGRLVSNRIAQQSGEGFHRRVSFCSQGGLSLEGRGLPLEGGGLSLEGTCMDGASKLRGICMEGSPSSGQTHPARYVEIRSTDSRYASYWNVLSYRYCKLRNKKAKTCILILCNLLYLNK